MPSLNVNTLTVGDKLPELRVTMTAQKIVQAAAATRDWQPIHHDHEAAIKAGLRGIILNAPSQAGWISRYITDWAGAAARIKKLSFKMLDSLCPGDELLITGSVAAVEDRTEQGAWVTVTVLLAVGEKKKTRAQVLVVVPNGQLANLWTLAW
jgi:acyl dehydratase